MEKQQILLTSECVNNMLDETQIVDERSLTTRPEDLIQKTLTKAMKATNLKLHSLKVVNNVQNYLN